MPQMTPGQARVVDPILTNVARGYTNAAMVGMFLFPFVYVAQRGGKIIAFGKEAFRLYNTGRAPGGNVAEVQFGYAANDFSLHEHDLAGKVPIELMEEANAVPGVDLGSGAVTLVQDIFALELEYEQATLARNADNYGSDNKDALTGDDQWSDPDSDPVKAVSDASEVIRKKIGVRPNTLELGAEVFAALQVHPKIVDRIKYTGRDVATVELLAQLFKVKRVVTGDAVYADASGEFHDVWGGDAILAYTDISSTANQGKPSYGYTYRLRNRPVVEEAYFDRKAKSWMYPISDASQAVLAGADAGFLFQNAV